MKLSVSLAAEDVEILDNYARTTGLPSRSAALHHAIRMLRLPHLDDDYAAAWDGWESSGDAALWETTAADGTPDATR